MTDRQTGGNGHCHGNVGSDSDSEPEVIILGRETADPSLLLPPHHQHQNHHQQQPGPDRRSLSLARAQAEGEGDVPHGADGEGGSGGVQGGAGVGGEGAPSCLPGECVVGWGCLRDRVLGK